jgi:predicted dehydrogenase
MLGNIRKVYVEYPQGWLSGEEETHNKQAQWRTDPAISGATGAMGDIGTHAFGLVEFVLNDSVTSLCGELNTHVEGRRLDDDGAALIKTKKGASGVLIASQVCAGEENALKIRVYGDKGGLEWRQMEPNSVIYRPVAVRRGFCSLPCSSRSPRRLFRSNGKLIYRLRYSNTRWSKGQSRRRTWN